MTDDTNPVEDIRDLADRIKPPKDKTGNDTVHARADNLEKASKHLKDYADTLEKQSAPDTDPSEYHGTVKT